MNRKEAEDFIYKSYLKAQQYQDYQAKDSVKRRNDLTYDLIHKKSYAPCTVVTGSKGKGSVANMISQILQSEYTVGLMTSPHIVDFCERFRVNGGKISGENFVRQVLLIEQEIKKIDESLPKDVCISPMGIQTYLALNYFESQKTEFNVFECGKGAKFDDVNNVKHDYAVINSIFLEHTRELGETIEEIAEDKAHVITGEQKCVYVAEQVPGVMKVIQDRADRLGVPLKIYGKDFFADSICYTKEGTIFDVVLEGEIYSDILIPLLGEHQAKNCALAFALCKDVLEDLKFEKEKCRLENFELERKKREVSDSEFGNKNQKIENRNLEKIKENLLKTNWPGRMEVISKSPFILLDACINGISCKNVMEVLEHLEIEKASFIIGIPDDKDYAGVVRGVEKKASQIILTKSQNPHYVFTQKQQERLKEEGIDAVWTEGISEAIDLAVEKENSVVILGTTSVIGEVKKLKL